MKRPQAGNAGPSRGPVLEPGQGPELLRQLGLLDCTLLVIGLTIGSGIFLTTGLIAAELPSPPLILLAWAVGGAITLAGALTFAELGAAMPSAGGQYVYLREAYGPLSAFLFGWLAFTVYGTGVIAAVAVGFATSLGYFVPALGVEHILVTVPLLGAPISAGQLCAAIAVLVLTLVNARALAAGSALQNLLTVLKLGALLLLIGLGLVVTGHAGSLNRATASAEADGLSLLSSFGVALVAVLWTYDGWHQLNFSAGEIKRPDYNIPRALIIGTVTITVIYLLCNVVYLVALPITEAQGEVRIAEKAALALFGSWGSTLIAVAAVVSTLGAVTGLILTGGRVYFAMARDGLFFAPAARVHPRFRTPNVALWLQGAWACLLCLSGSYDQLFTYAMFAALGMYAAAATALFRLRSAQPHLARPYRAWGYPVVPAAFLLSILLVMVATLIERPQESMIGILITIAGVPVFYVWRRARTPKIGLSEVSVDT